MRIVRKVHRYFALVLGLAILAWIASGIMISLRAPTPGGLTKAPNRAPDFASVTLPPADVIARFRSVRGPDGEVARIVLRPLRDRLAYEVHARGQRPLMLDAHSGEVIEVTPELAVAVARDRLAGDVGRAQVERLDRHRTTYPWGPLPVYRLEFENGRGTIAYVSLADASVSFTSPKTQIWRFLASFHSFEPVKMLFGSDGLRNKLLLLAAVLSLVIVGTGYCMEAVLWPKRRRKRASK